MEWMRLSCHEFKDNAVRLALFVLADNLGNFLRRLAPPREIAAWSLVSLRETDQGGSAAGDACPNACVPDGGGEPNQGAAR
jgi:hypothetical protein